MAKLDPFSAQIVKLVRSMPDEAILALVRDQLGVVGEAAAPSIVATPRKRRTTKRKKAAKKAVVKRVSATRITKAKKTGRPKKRTSAARQKVLSAVERAVKTSKGMSASQVAKATGIGQVRVATALRELKLGKKIYQGGDRRFARYAGTKKGAVAASLSARQNASGPVIKRRGRRKKR